MAQYRRLSLVSPQAGWALTFFIAKKVSKRSRKSELTPFKQKIFGLPPILTSTKREPYVSKYFDALPYSLKASFANSPILLSISRYLEIPDFRYQERRPSRPPS